MPKTREEIKHNPRGVTAPTPLLRCGGLTFEVWGFGVFDFRFGIRGFRFGFRVMGIELIDEGVGFMV